MPMADPVYPNQPPSLITDPERELPEHATPSHLGRIPSGHDPNSRLRGVAEKVGGALGTAVSSVRHMPNRLQEAKKRFTVIRGRKQADVREAADQAIDRIRDAGQEVKGEAQARLRQARARTERLAHEYPLHVVGGAAAFGMLMGIGLRLWRDYAG